MHVYCVCFLKIEKAMHFYTASKFRARAKEVAREFLSQRGSFFRAFLKSIFSNSTSNGSYFHNPNLNRKYW
jgi:hypothetical protein